MARAKNTLITNALEKVLKHEKNILIFSKYLQKAMNKDENENNRILYQVCQDIIQNKNNLKQILLSLKNGKVGWNHPMYNDIESKIEEHDNYIINPFEVAEGVIECGKCGSTRTFSIQKQCRSSDEPMTTFSRCVECGNNWTYAG